MDFTDLVPYVTDFGVSSGELNVTLLSLIHNIFNILNI